MNFNPKKYASNLYMSIAHGPERRAAEDQAQKLAALANDLQHLFKEMDVWRDGLSLLVRIGAFCPHGFVEDVTFRDQFLMGPDAAGQSVYTLGGSDTHQHTMTHAHTGSADTPGSGHYHTIAPSSHSHGGTTSSYAHSHTVGLVTGYAGGGTYDANDVASTGIDTHSHTITTDTATHDHGTATGNPAGTAEGLHSHPLTINQFLGSTGLLSWRPPYVRVLFCRKVA